MKNPAYAEFQGLLADTPMRRLRKLCPRDDVALWALLRGTVFYDADVPSHGDMPDFGIWRGLLPAAAGYATAMPDYLGFGASRQFWIRHHPPGRSTRRISAR